MKRKFASIPVHCTHSSTVGGSRTISGGASFDRIRPPCLMKVMVNSKGKNRSFCVTSISSRILLSPEILILLFSYLSLAGIDSGNGEEHVDKKRTTLGEGSVLTTAGIQRVTTRVLPGIVKSLFIEDFSEI